jgi:hypothetical protein
MPDSEPNVDAPTYILAGDIDMQVFFDQLGMGWMTPYMPPPIPRLVVVEELCALPQPSAIPFTGIDIARMREGDEAALEARHKLANYVDRDLWAANCRYVDDTPAEPTVPFDPPDDLPAPPPPSSAARREEDMYRWMRWLVQQILPRSADMGDIETVSGSGFVELPTKFGGEWEVNAAGVRIVVTEKPDYVGRSNGGDFPVYYDLGWFSLSNDAHAQPPIRLNHDKMRTYTSVDMVTRFYYNLAPGVTIQVRPVYPQTATPDIEGF